MTLRIQIDGLEQVREDLEELAPRAQDYVLRQMAGIAERGFEVGARKHSRSGNLFRSIFNRAIPGGYQVGHDPTLTRVDDDGGRWSGRSYAEFVTLGTRAHEIRARRKKALRFVQDGVFVFYFGPRPKSERGKIAAWVREKGGPGARVSFRWPKHPGYVGDAYHIRAADDAVREFDRLVNEALRREEAKK